MVGSRSRATNANKVFKKLIVGKDASVSRVCSLTTHPTVRRTVLYIVLLLGRYGTRTVLHTTLNSWTVDLHLEPTY